MTTLLDQWEAYAEENENLTYSGGGRDNESLLANFGKPKEGHWEALSSMRNVDHESPLWIIKEKSEEDPE